MTHGAERRRRIGASVIVALVFCAALVSLALALTFPALTGRVVDEAGILDPATKAMLDRKLADFETKTTGQIVVVTLKSLQDTSIDDYGYQLGRHWGIGTKEKNSGALLIVAPNERKVRIEVGYGLEGNLTDAVSKLIIQNSILPRFRAGDFPGGIVRGVDDMIQVLTIDPEDWKARAKQRPDAQPAFMDVLVFVLLLLVLLTILRSMSRRGPPGGPGARDPRGRRGGFGRGPVIIPMPMPGPRDWGGGGWSDGGGFSGGGGSFGGGGASGEW